MTDKPIMLIVDDNEFSRAVLKAIFDGDYETLEAQDGQECMNILQKRIVNIVLLDTIMPKMDGFEVLRRIKSDPSLAAIPVVTNTVGDSEDTESYALELGAADYITKPYRADVVRKRVSNIVLGSDSERLRLMAETDWLTGIYNRSAFARYTKAMLLNNLKTQYVLICWNIERFKIINDIFGAEMGDALLKDIAKTLRSMCTEHGGVCGRLEADNFACCFPYDEFDIENIIKNTKRSLPSANIQYEINIGVGIYVIDDIALPISTMCDRASIALHTIKGSYLRRYAFYDDKLREKMLVEQEIFTEMETALEERQFCVYFQPQYSSEREEPVGAEALVRWKHPKRGMISPGVFVPQFESNGFITKLDYFVWEEACRFLADRISAKKTVLPVSVNISRINFYDEDLCDKIINIVKKYDLKPELFHLEITESVYNENHEQLMGAMRRLQKEGFYIAMDDFGSGYSSLNMLKDLPVNILKIDMKFVSDIEKNERAGSVLTSVVRMAKWLEMRVIAEGVETLEQKDFLSSIGCDVIQGYYYSKPLPREEYEKLIEHIEPVKLENGGYDASDIACFMKASRDTDIMFNSIARAAGIYELYNGSMEILRVNEEYYRLTGATPQTLIRETKSGLAWVESTDRQIMLDACAAAEKTGEVQRVAVRRYHKDGTLMAVDVKIRCLGTRQGYSMYYITMDTMPDSMALSCPVVIPAQNTDEAYVQQPDERHTIMIVDDNKINRIMLKKLLLSEYDVIEAENGRHALEVLEKCGYKVSAILLDLVMPVMNGFEFLSARFDNAKLDTIPVIVLTQGEEPDSEIRALKLGATDFLKKPCDAESIINRLKNDIAISNSKSHRISVQSVINNLPCGVLVYYCTEKDVRGMYVNEVLCDAVNIPHEECIKLFEKDGFGMVRDEDKQELKRKILAASLLRSDVHAEFRVKTRSGKAAWVRLRANFSHMEGTHVVYYAFLADVTKERNTLNELKERSEQLENVNAKLSIAIDQSKLYMWEHDLCTNTVYASPTLQKRFGWKDDTSDFETLCVSAGLSRENIKGIAEPALRRLRNGETPVSALLPLESERGNERWERVKYILHIEEHGKPRIAIAVARDITDETVTQRRYENAEGFRRSVIKDMLAFIEYDFTDAKLISLYPAELSARANGMDIVKEVIDGHITYTDNSAALSVIIHPDKLRSSIEDGRTEDSLECRITSPFGTWQGERWVNASLSYRISNETGHTMAFISVRDISERKAKELSLRHQARRDPLTGLKNRISFNEHAGTQLKQTIESGSLAAYYIIDIDNFKNINDTHGHAFGDNVLLKLAQKLKKVFRVGDTIARLGGDEVVVFIDNIPSVAYAVKRGEDICRAMEQEKIGESHTQVTCSVGVAIAPRDGSDLDNLYRHADHALYCVKRNGKSRCYLYDGDGTDDGENNTM